MYASLVAAQIGLDEAKLVKDACLSSEDDQREYLEHVKRLDEELHGWHLMRKVVPGDGDCQFHAIIAALREVGLDEGNVMDVRVKIYHQLQHDAWKYQDFVATDDYPAWCSTMLHRGNWGDDAFVDATGYAIKIYSLHPDAGAGDLKLRITWKMPYWLDDLDTPEIVLTICHMMEHHFDTVVPLKKGKRAAAPEQKPEKRKAGYDLRDRKPSKAGIEKHKYAISEDKVDDTCRGTKWTPGAIGLITRSLVVALQVLGPKYLEGSKKVKKRQIQRTIDLIRSLGKTSAEKRAIEGCGLPAGKPLGDPPLTAEELVDNAIKWSQRCRNQALRNEALPEGTPESEAEYMQARLVLNRTLHWDEDAEAYFFVAAGVSPVKTEKAKRLSRGYFVSRKFLSKKWSAEFSAWMETDWPILVSYYKLPAEGPTFKPPARPGCAPFLPIPYDTFRKGIRMVCRACSTDVRGAAEGYLIVDPEITGRLHQVRTLQRFVGHDEKTSLKHYHVLGSRALSSKLQKLSDKASKKTKTAKKAKK
ncbi:unnamed protein product [Effrenium voratum]|nr:unnamed protein product [Effrenium voratum]